MWGILNPNEREFQKRKPRGKHKTKYETVSYTMFTAAPNTEQIRKTVQRYESQGWVYGARHESEGFLGFGAHTKLTFWLYQNEPQSVSGASQVKKQGCISQLFLTLTFLVGFAIVILLVAAFIFSILGF